MAGIRTFPSLIQFYGVGSGLISRELDLDDLIPILKVDAKDLEETFNKGFLVELIAMSERTKNSMVAEVKKHECSAIFISFET